MQVRGLLWEDMVPIFNLKREHMLIGSLKNQPEILPACHMDNEHWITILLRGSLPEDEASSEEKPE